MKDDMFSNLWRDLLSARSVLAVSVLLVAIHVAVEIRGGFESVWMWYETLGLTRAGVAKGWFWQLGTHALLHGHWLHLGLNVLALLLVGSRLVRIGGPSMFLRVIGAGILAGGVLHLLLAGSNPWPLVGISGGVFAAVLFLTSISPGSRMWPLPVSGKNLGLGVMIACALLASLNPALGWGAWSEWGRQLDVLFGGGLGNMSHACHLGGAVAGMLAARWTLRPRVTLQQLQQDRLRREGAKVPD